MRRAEPVGALARQAFADGGDGAHHEIAAGDQDHGIDGAGFAIEVLLRFVEQLDIVGAGKGVRKKKYAECQQFGKNEKPDCQIAWRSAWLVFVQGKALSGH